MNLEKTIYSVIKTKMCSYCGFCIVVCPNSVISFMIDNSDSHPKINFDKNKCSYCGLCNKVCPKLNFIQSLLKPSIDPIQYYRVLSKKTSYTINCSSGGLVNLILKEAFDSKLIDSCIVVQNSFETKCFSWKTELFFNFPYSIGGSIYFPVNYAYGIENLLEILKVKSNLKVAIVGIPCQIEGLEYYLKYMHRFEKNFVLKIGLFCLTNNYQPLLCFKKRFDYSSEKIRYVHFRFGEGSNKVKFITKRNQEISYNFRTDFAPILYLTLPISCRVCTNHTNYTADISIGDNWLKTKGDHEALMVIRSKKVIPLIEKLKTTGLIYIYQISKKYVIYAQKDAIFLKNQIHQIIKYHYIQKKTRNEKAHIPQFVISYFYLKSWFFNLYLFRIIYTKILNLLPFVIYLFNNFENLIFRKYMHYTADLKL